MTEKEAQQVLDEMQRVRPEQLNGEARRLFEAIMKIADKRDELKEKVEQKDKIIDLMSEQLTTPIHDKKWVKEYYERKAREVE